MSLKELIYNSREKTWFQIFYGISLIVIILSLFVFNSYSIIDRYNGSSEVASYQEAFTVAKTVGGFLKEDLDNEERFEARLKMLMAKNSKITSASILQKVDVNKNEFEIVASSFPDDIGKKTDFEFYQMAWNKNEDDGIAVSSKEFNKRYSNGENINVRELNQGGNFYLTVVPLYNDNGEKKYLLSLSVSNKAIESLMSENTYRSMRNTAISVAFIFLLLSFILKLWDYALLYRKTKEVDKMKDEFISMASHELRTPVTGIKGFLSMVLDGSMGTVDDKARKGLEIVAAAAERLNILVEDILNISRIEQGRLKIEMMPTEIGDIVKDVVVELKVQADQKNLALNYMPLTDKIISINIDKERLKQILINLIGNSIKYTEKGSIDVRVEAIDNYKKLAIKIKDTGIGISATDKVRLFEKFYRVRNSKTAEIVGTGLGLWIVKQLVELQNGKIDIDSIENVGTQFTVSFPIVKKV